MNFIIKILRFFGLTSWADAIEVLLKAYQEYKTRRTQEAQEAQAETMQEVKDEIDQATSAIHDSSDDALAEYFRTGELHKEDS